VLLLEHAVLVQIFLSDALFRGVVIGFPERACMDCSILARCSGGILASRSGGMSDPLVRVVILISHAPGLTSKESASAKDVIRGMKLFGMSPATVSITVPLKNPGP